jgi:hypothetical protein
MKSGYGMNISAEPFIRISTTHEGTGATSAAVHFSPTATGFAAAPQYVFAYFREFNFGVYNRQLESENNRFVFRRNRFSTFDNRVHYTPWWLPDGTDYDVVVSSQYAFTPAGRLSVSGVSNSITIEGNLIHDWRIVASR